jgi:mitogen-activated protein kinase 1/3
MDHVETDLSKIIKLGPACQVDKSHVRNILYNLLCALNYLASANVIHRDIKPGNILMNKYCQIRICDFGLARTLPKSAIDANSIYPFPVRKSIMDKQIHVTAQSSIRSKIIKKIHATSKERTQRKRNLSSHVGSRWYRAPEIILVEKNYDHAIDTWSVGVILYELSKLSQRNLTKDTDTSRVTMFQGHYCYPLTPPRKDSKANEID